MFTTPSTKNASSPQVNPCATQEAAEARRWIARMIAAKRAGRSDLADIAAIMAARSVDAHLIAAGIRQADR